MDEDAAIAYVARSEARNVVRRRDDDDASGVDATIPLFRIKKDANNKYACKFVAGLTDDYTAGYRAPAYEHFFANNVLPYVDPALDVSGLYHLELHDSASKAAIETTDGHGAFTFGKDLENVHAGRNRALLPDFYQILGYSRGRGVPSLIELKDGVAFQDKVPKVLFAGTTTGDMDPLKNQRVQACRWAYGVDPTRAKYELYLTSCRQIPPEEMYRKVPEAPHLFKDYVREEDHYRYRYILNVVGNTSCWSRVPLIMCSNSVMINLKHDQGGWYYPLMRSGVHFVNIPTIQDLPKAVEACEKNPAMCKVIAKNANLFAKKHFSVEVAAAYARILLEEVAWN